MAKQQSDDELNLRRKARRRLIGAVALTLAIVVILPMILDRQPSPTGKDIDLRIPSPDKVGELVPGSAVSEVASSPANTTIVSAPMAAAPAVLSTQTQPQPQPQPIVEQPKPLAAPVQSPPAKLATPAEPSMTTKASPATKTEKPAITEGYVVQVAAYSNPSAAKQELDRLKKWGFKAYTEKSGDKIRVRVGPYPNRDKAVKVGKLLEKHGLHPVILSAK